MGGGSDLQRLPGGENCLLGMVTGVWPRRNHPFLSQKNTTQQGIPISFNPRRSMGPAHGMHESGGTNAVQFGATGPFRAGSIWLRDRHGHVGGSFLGGAASGVPCSIWELCMIQQQRFGGSTLGTPAKFINEFGASSLGRGVTMTIGRESMFTMSMLGITPLIQQNLVEKSGMESNTALAIGALTGALFAGTITHPMDTIKTCMQGDLGQIKYKGIADTGRLLMEEYGVMQGLFKGLFFRVCLISTTFFLVNTFKQKTVPILFPHAVGTASAEK